MPEPFKLDEADSKPDPDLSSEFGEPTLQSSSAFFFFRIEPCFLRVYAPARSASMPLEVRFLRSLPIELFGLLLELFRSRLALMLLAVASLRLPRHTS